MKTKNRGRPSTKFVSFIRKLKNDDDAYFQAGLTRHIRSDHPDSLNLLSEKLERLRLLSLWYRKVNSYFKDNGSLKGLIISEYWQSIFNQNIDSFGVPVTQKMYSANRRMIKFTKDRIKNLSSIPILHDSRINIIDSFIVVNAPLILKSELKKLFNLKLSFRFNSQGSFVRKFTGQSSDFFDSLTVYLNNHERGSHD